ncbi:MAG: hypothetical protein N2319_08470 [Candidatus Kapabacteria bacterium]|nr:hypothetical protein [Candidatus Kapabacteria bacterium]
MKSLLFINDLCDMDASSSPQNDYFLHSLIRRSDAERRTTPPCHSLLVKESHIILNMIVLKKPF